MRQTEALVQETIDAADSRSSPWSAATANAPSRAGCENEHVAALEQQFRTALGVKVKITHNARGRGKLVIHFGNHEEFERLRRYLCDPGHPQADSQSDRPQGEVQVG